MNTARPLDALSSIKVKLGLLVGVSVVVAVLVAAVGDAAQVPWWTSVPVTVAAALARHPVAGTRDDLAAARDDPRRPDDGRR